MASSSSRPDNPTAPWRPLASLLVLAGAWQAASWITADATILPPPLALLPLFHGELVDGPLLAHLGATLTRVVAAFSLSMLIGLPIGYAMGRSRLVDGWLDPWLVVFLNLPALVVIVLCYLWIGLNETAAIIAVTANKVPTVVTMLREGARALSPDIDAMANVFRLSRWRRLRHVVLPQLAPFTAAAARSGLALVWKIVLVAEFLGRSTGIGFQIQRYFQLWDVPRVLVYALAFAAVMLVIEAAVMRPMERAARRWRER